MDKSNYIILKEFIAFCKSELNIQTLPKITLIADSNFVLTFRSFGEYNPAEKTIKVFYPTRNLADVCRSLAHELCHHRQNELGLLDVGAGDTGSDIENDANAMAGILMRDFGKINSNVYQINQPQSLQERKQVGDLYHFTSYRGMVGIIESGLKLSSNVQPYVSFTRNKQMVSDTISQSVRITIDGTKLSDRYKIDPYADTSAGYGRTTRYTPGTKLTGDESEERISLEKYPDGVDISKVIKMVDIRKLDKSFDWEDPEDFEDFVEPPSLEHYNKLIKLLKEKGIPYQIV